MDAFGRRFYVNHSSRSTARQRPALAAMVASFPPPSQSQSYTSATATATSPTGSGPMSSSDAGAGTSNSEPSPPAATPSPSAPSAPAAQAPAAPPEAAKSSPETSTSSSASTSASTRIGFSDEGARAAAAATVGAVGGTSTSMAIGGARKSSPPLNSHPCPLPSVSSLDSGLGAAAPASGAATMSASGSGIQRAQTLMPGEQTDAVLALRAHERFEQRYRTLQRMRRQSTDDSLVDAPHGRELLPSPTQGFETPPAPYAPQDATTTSNLSHEIPPRGLQAAAVAAEVAPVLIPDGRRAPLATEESLAISSRLSSVPTTSTSSAAAHLSHSSSPAPAPVSITVSPPAANSSSSSTGGGSATDGPAISRTIALVAQSAAPVPLSVTLPHATTALPPATAPAPAPPVSATTSAAASATVSASAAASATAASSASVRVETTRSSESAAQQRGSAASAGAAGGSGSTIARPLPPGCRFVLRSDFLLRVARVQVVP